MLVDPQSDRVNRRWALGICALCAALIACLALIRPIFLIGLPIVLGMYFLLRRRSTRRLRVIRGAFPEAWEATLLSDVAFFRALDEPQRERFRNLVKVFLDEVRITGIRTTVDDRTRVLVAASAVIPILGFDDWEYNGLGEVLIYPDGFDEQYQNASGDRHILGMVGTGHLSGVMILSQPDLISGFANPEDKRNVGIHEFAHLVDKADGSVDGLPIGIDQPTAAPWVQWVGEELKSTSRGRHHIDDYAYTNEAEYFAVLTEYFFEAPEVLAKKNPQLYQMMQSMYRQNTKSLLSGIIHRPRRVGRNSPCPCGSGDKFKHCCLRKSRQGA
ncbi:M90 family metallopeptidase [Stieleria varia]|uniref:Protein MtfA n=1 Tax=Stieleria varia TaxID=2528005 RepID=A0A5C6B2U7_9BACT|nr:M90 family metallopeptidase [Stieleria varia]TWU06443.1 hypothetical protein Pla52n_21640 [Stieleria varia]